MDMDLRYGEMLHRIVSRQSNSGCSLWCPVVMIWARIRCMKIYYECEYLVKDNNQQVCMGATENRYVHRYSSCVWFVQAYSKVSLTAQQKKDENT